MLLWPNDVYEKHWGLEENPAIPFRTLGLSERMDDPIGTRTMCMDICREREEGEGRDQRNR